MSATSQTPSVPSQDATAERKRLLARIHCCKAELGWSDEEYRDILQAKTGQRSAAALGFLALRRLAAELGEKTRQAPAGSGPVKADARKRSDERDDWSFINRAAEEKRPLLRKIFAVCRELGGGRTYAEGVAKRQCGSTRRLEMMDYGELWKVAAALATTQRGKAAKAQAQEEQGVTA